MSDPAFKAMSVEEYLRTEESSPFKREYVGGFAYPLHATLHGQAGAKRPHTLISGRIFARLYDAAEQSGCRLYQSEMRLSIEQ